MTNAIFNFQSQSGAIPVFSRSYCLESELINCQSVDEWEQEVQEALHR